MTKIIAFAGKKQSGKTTCSDYVCNHYSTLHNYNKSAKVLNFADSLKQDICMNILGLSHKQCYGDDSDKNTITNIKWDNKYLTAREAMQFIGTDLFRKMNPNVWADATINKISKLKIDLAIIADCRFPNEVEAVKNAGGIVIKLTRNIYNETHSSETALDPDYYDQNNFDLIVTNHNLSIERQNQTIIAYLEQKGVFQL